jgi:hypothetical protein
VIVIAKETETNDPKTSLAAIEAARYLLSNPECDLSMFWEEKYCFGSLAGGLKAWRREVPPSYSIPSSQSQYSIDGEPPSTNDSLKVYNPGSIMAIYPSQPLTSSYFFGGKTQNANIPSIALECMNMLLLSCQVLGMWIAKLVARGMSLVCQGG